MLEPGSRGAGEPGSRAWEGRTRDGCFLTVDQELTVTKAEVGGKGEVLKRKKGQGRELER